MWYLLDQDCVRRDGEGSRGVAKRSQMRALLTIGKMGKRFQKNESLRRYRSLVRSLSEGSQAQGVAVGDATPRRANRFRDSSRPHPGPLPEGEGEAVGVTLSRSGQMPRQSSLTLRRRCGTACGIAG